MRYDHETLSGLLVLSLIGAFTTPCQAQDQQDTLPFPVVNYTLSGEGLWLAGNTSRLIVGGRGRAITMLSPRYQLVVSPSYFFGKVNGRITDREARVETLGYFAPGGFQQSAMHGFIIGIYAQSQLRNVDERWQAGAGITRRIVTSKYRRLLASLAVLVEKTTFSSGFERTPTRFSVRIEGHTVLGNSGLKLGVESFLKPAFDDVSDVIWLSLATLDVSLAPRLSAQVALDYIYESVVPSALKPHDSRLTFGVKFSS